MSTAKKIFIGSSTLFIIMLLFWGIYNLSFKKNLPENPTNDEKELSSASKSAGANIDSDAKIIPISQEEVIAPVLEDNGNAIRYYSKKDGRVYEIDLNGNTTKTVSTRELPGIVDVFWSPDNRKVISKFSRPGNQFQFFYYNYQESKGTALKSNLDMITWQNNNRIFYKYFDPKTKIRTLNVADADGSNWTKLADLDYKFISIAPVPRSSLVSYWNKADAFSSTLMQTTPTIGGEKKTIFKDKFGADFLWSRNGNNLLVSHSKERGGAEIQLAILNDQGGEYNSLNVPTFVSKCVWSKDNKNVFCALPGSIPNGAVLPNDYNDRKFNTADTFWKIDTTTGKKERVISVEQIKGDYDASKMFLNLDESLLFFVNRIDGKLYKIIL